MRTSVAARVFDPLWLMARQWQVGEFQGEDAGSPVIARVRAVTAPLALPAPRAAVAACVPWPLSTSCAPSLAMVS